jgi:hypothetical protein
MFDKAYNQNSKLVKYILFALIFIVVIIVIIVGILILNSSDDIISNISQGSTCTKENTTFAVSPIEIENISNIAPLGNLNPSGHTFPTVHMYYFIQKEDAKDFNSTSKLVSVYAPIDATIETMSVMTRTDINPPVTDFSINFRVCEDFTFYFIHVTSLSDKLQEFVDELKSDDCNQYSTGGRDFETCWIGDLDIKVETGELLGTAGGAVDKNALDFGVTDFRIEPHVFANPDRWSESRDDYFYKVCSTDYYEGELKLQLESKLGDFDGTPRTIDPICGTNAQDIPGTVQGIWFAQGTTEVEQEDPHIALVHDNFDPSKGVFSNGTSLENIGIPVGTYYFDPQQSGKVNLDFNLLEPGSGVHCYEVAESFSSQDNSFSILVELTQSETLKIGRFDSPVCGSGDWTMNNYFVFER